MSFHNCMTFFLPCNTEEGMKNVLFCVCHNIKWDWSFQSSEMMSHKSDIIKVVLIILVRYNASLQKP